jgi:hypothetical protein
MPSPASNANIGLIGVGDIIVLGYRSPNTFRVSLPLVVKSEGPFTRPIRPQSDGCNVHDHHPFAIANDELSEVLATEGYSEDPVSRARCGLNVDPLAIPGADVAADGIFKAVFPSPGMNTIWPITRERFSDQLCDWIDTL